jgi:LysR family transcriptional regulator, nod-box dependent transcriptional activator
MRLNRLDLNLTVCLDSLLAERNVSHAASRLFVSQPAMSIALRRLREHFDDDLLVQVGRKYQLTAFAQTLKNPVRDAVLQMQAISGLRAKFDPATSNRSITIGASDYVMTVYVARALERVHLQAPGLQVSLRTMDVNYLENLNSGDVDLLIVPQTFASKDHPSHPLFRDTFSCMVWKGNTFVKRSLTQEQYLRLGHVAIEWDGGRLSSLDEIEMHRLGLMRKREVILSSFTMAAQMVVGTSRIATVQTQLANVMAARWPIRVLRCPISLPPIVEMIQWHTYQERDPAILWFIELLKKVASEVTP